MLIASLICSDPDCAEERDVVAASLDAVDREAPCCDGGCTLVVLAVSGWEPAARPARPRPRLVAPARGGAAGAGAGWGGGGGRGGRGCGGGRRLGAGGGLRAGVVDWRRGRSRSPMAVNGSAANRRSERRG